MIATAKKYRKKGVATSLINFTNNKLMKKSNSIIAGTQLNNFSAIKMYQKLDKKHQKRYFDGGLGWATTDAHFALEAS